MKTKVPTKLVMASELGKALDIWNKVIALVTEKVGVIEQEWKASKAAFGWMCLLKHKKRTILYLTPEKSKVRVALVLGERAVGKALASGLPESIKCLIREARPYIEGRGIRFMVSSMADVNNVSDLITIKMAPK